MALQNTEHFKHTKVIHKKTHTVCHGVSETMSYIPNKRTFNVMSCYEKKNVFEIVRPPQPASADQIKILIVALCVIL